MKRRFIRSLIIGIPIGIVVALVSAALWLNSSYATAEAMARHGLWPRARNELQRYLWIRPGDERALLLMAETLVKDESLPQEKSVPEALGYLRGISDNSPLGAMARLQEGRLQFLLMHRPVAAERALRRAVQLDPKSLESYLMLINLLEMTGRYTQTEEYFWKSYDLSSVEERPLRLREWYDAQYSTIVANELLDRQMGFVGLTESSTRESESRRYMSFRDNEKNESLGHAALAAWLQREGQPQMALDVLDKAPEFAPDVMQDPFYVSTLIAALVDLGKMQRAEEVFSKWPGPKEGFAYWSWKAILDEEVHNNLDSAIEAYTKALDVWPGQTDWRLRFRKVNCLLQAGKVADAAMERKRAAAIERLMDDQVHSRIRLALENLDDPKRIPDVIDFYRKLGREREAKCWDEYLQRLATRTSPAGADVPNRSP